MQLIFYITLIECNLYLNVFEVYIWNEKAFLSW